MDVKGRIMDSANLFGKEPAFGPEGNPMNEILDVAARNAAYIVKLETENERLQSFANWCKSPAYDPGDLTMNAINALKGK